MTGSYEGACLASALGLRSVLEKVEKQRQVRCFQMETEADFCTLLLKWASVTLPTTVSESSRTTRSLCVSCLSETEMWTKVYIQKLSAALERRLSSYEHCSSGEPRLCFQHPHGGSPLSVAPVLGDPMPSSDCHTLNTGGAQTYVQTPSCGLHRHLYTHTHK